MIMPVPYRVRPYACLPLSCLTSNPTHTISQTTQAIISRQRLFLGVRWLDWNLDRNTDIVLSFTKQLTREFPLAIDWAHHWSLMHSPNCPTLILFFNPFSTKSESRYTLSSNPSNSWHLSINGRHRSALRGQSCDASPIRIISCRGGSWQRSRRALCFSWKLRQRARVTAGCVRVLRWALTCCERARDSAALSGSTGAWAVWSWWWFSSTFLSSLWEEIEETSQ